MDNGGGPHLQRAPEGTGEVQGVWGGDGRGIYGKSYDDSAWAGGIGATELENPGHGGQATDISDVLSGQGRPTELPGEGMPGTSGDEDGDAGSLPTLECPGHCGPYGGGNPHPPTVQPMQYSGTLEGNEQKAPCHSSVNQGNGSEEAAASRGGAEGELGEVL